MARMVGRIVMAVAAVCVAGVLGAQLYAQERLDEGRVQVFLAGERPLPPERRESVLSDLRAAERLRPGTEAVLGQALVRLRAGQTAEAERLARRAVHREPENHEAYAALAATLAGTDPAAARRASARARELNPPVRP
jgi:predicted Zn-dependent protease